jgi:hypothetical protein
MLEQAEFKSSRASNLSLGIGLLALTGCIVWLVGFSSEEELLHSHARKSGIFKLIEQAVGWPAFCFMAACFGFWLLVYSVVHIWKALDSTPDVTALPNCIEFHPAVRRTAASYSDISHWSIEYVSGHPVVWIHLHQAYWSLQGLFKRKTIKLEGGRDKLAPLVDYFSHHHVMSQKFMR